MADIRYLLIAHPDDEVASWSLIDPEAEAFWVLVLLTRGERTSFGDGRGLRAGLGERVPEPQPFGGAGSEACRRQRLDSWHAFLDAMAAVQGAIDVTRRRRSRHPLGGPARGCEVWVGERSARVAFDLGDGALRAAEVVRAFDVVRGLRGSLLPDLDDEQAVAACYFNDEANGSHRYAHPDHRAVHEALFGVDHDLSGPQLGRTGRGSTAAAERGRTEEIDAALYEQMMAVGEDGQRLGLMQTCYGWLTDEPWPSGELDDVTGWSRSQTFWERY
jgi:LmbE family N-acetylglucosaminyl deacetylase